MSDEKLINNGYQPSSQREERGYQPVAETAQRPNPQSGYQPTSTGSSPTNVPTPPRER